MGDPAQLAGALRAALAVTATPPAPAPAPSTPATSALAEFDAAGVAAALGRAGTAEGGVYKITAARADTISEDGRVLPAGTGVTTAVNFQPLGGGRAAVNGDIVMVGQEVQKVIAALRGGGVQIVEVHNHGLTEQPAVLPALLGCQRRCDRRPRAAPGPRRDQPTTRTLILRVAGAGPSAPG